MIISGLTLDSLSEVSRSLGKDIIITGKSALVINKLIRDNFDTVSITCLKEAYSNKNYNVQFEYAHLRDMYKTVRLADGVYVPTSEKSLLDTIVWYPENVDKKTVLIALHNYKLLRGDAGLDRLYNIADHYKVPRQFINYWWKEADYR